MSIESQLKLNDISIVDVQFKRNEAIEMNEWNESENNGIQYAVEPEMALSANDKHNGRLALTVTLFDEEYEEKDFPLFIKVTMHAYFEDTNKENDRDVFEMYAVNMVSMIYPYVRSFIATLTATSGMEAINIPTINVLELFSQKFKELNSEESNG